MKNTDEFLNKMASRARLEKAPEVDITNGVLAALRSSVEEEASSIAPLAWIAGISLAVAITVAIFALTAWDALTSSLISLISEIPWGLL